jgi:hypothetical protein
LTGFASEQHIPELRFSAIHLIWAQPYLNLAPRWTFVRGKFSDEALAGSFAATDERGIKSPYICCQKPRSLRVLGLSKLILREPTSGLENRLPRGSSYECADHTFFTASCTLGTISEANRRMLRSVCSWVPLQAPPGPVVPRWCQNQLTQTPGRVPMPRIWHTYAGSGRVTDGTRTRALRSHNPPTSVSRRCCRLQNQLR